MGYTPAMVHHSSQVGWHDIWDLDVPFPASSPREMSLKNHNHLRLNRQHGLGTLFWQLDLKGIEDERCLGVGAH
jgi:hypothetical protein